MTILYWYKYFCVFKDNPKNDYFCIMIDYINIHTHKACEEGICLLNISSAGDLPSEKFLSFGIHPWDIDKIDIVDHLEKLGNLCSEKKLIAVGEIGLDRAIKSSFEIQKEVFIKQLEIAEKFKLSVIIHCVRAWSDILATRKIGKYTNTWIFHGFNGNLQTASQIIKSGCYLSFGKALNSSIKLQEVFTQMPKEFIFFETDDSDIKIEEIYQKGAELYDIDSEELKKIICINFNNVFRKIN
jgi:TatD DNase family protein